jgi:hypothetical protein
MSTYLEIVNDVLARLRESSVSSVTQTTYATLIGKFVNDAKRQVENAWNWEALYTTISISTVAGTSGYTVTGSGKTQKNESIFDSTNQIILQKAPLSWIKQQQQLTTVQQGNAGYYAWSGNNGTDSTVELFPTPNSAATIKFNMYVPQVDLSADGDNCTVDGVSVALGAYTRAVIERGEDGGITSSDAASIYKSHLSDMISIDSSRHIENSEWIAI